MECEVTDFVEASPGVFFPRAATIRETAGQESFQRIRLSNVRVNDPIDPEVLRLRIPGGTIFTDNVLGKSYRVDAAGKVAGPVASYTPGLALAQSPKETDLGSQSKAEPMSRTIWFVIVPSASLLVLGFALWSARRLRRPA
jgi:hypothetical protein